ncbi:MAG: hypothetical protein ABWY52_02435 [Candidatus Limnocylindrales bacterium]
MTPPPGREDQLVSATIAQTGAWRRPSTWIAGALLAASLAMIGHILVSLVLPGHDQLPNRPDVATVLAVSCVFVSLPSVGAVLAILRPRNPIGWLFLVAGAGFIVSVFASEYVGRSVFLGADLPGYALVDWVSAWSTSLSLAIMVVWIPLLFPDGHLVGPRWRIVAWSAAVALGAQIVALAIQPSGPSGYDGLVTNPIAVGGPLGELSATLADLPNLAVFASLALLSLAIRFRRSSGIERQQLKWLLFAVGFLLAALSAAIVSQISELWYAVILGFAALPVAAAIAVLRYRLYEIDRIISRTVGYGIVTVTLAAVFVGGVLGLQAILAQFTGGNTVAVAASTLVVAALFQPLRGRIQRVVDRRFDRTRYDGQRVADAFAVRLRDEVDLDRLRIALVTTADDAVRPDSASVWLRPMSGQG